MDNNKGNSVGDMQELCTIFTIFCKPKGVLRIKIYLKGKKTDFSDGPVARTLCSQNRKPGFDPWSRSYVLNATAKIKDPACCGWDPAQANK